MDAQRRQWLPQAIRSRWTRGQFDRRYAARITLSAGLGFAIAKLLHLPQPFWSAITAVIVASSNLGGSLRAGSDRLLGTLAGAALGLAAALVEVLHVLRGDVAELLKAVREPQAAAA